MASLTLGARLNFTNPVIRRDVEHRSVLTEAAISSIHLRINVAQMRAIRREDPDTAWAGGEKIAFLVDFHAVRQALFTADPLSCVVVNAALPKRAVIFHIEGHPDRFFG